MRRHHSQYVRYPWKSAASAKKQELLNSKRQKKLGDRVALSMAVPSSKKEHQ
jgi:hypothetical protein